MPIKYQSGFGRIGYDMVRLSELVCLSVSGLECLSSLVYLGAMLIEDLSERLTTFIINQHRNTTATCMMLAHQNVMTLVSQGMG